MHGAGTDVIFMRRNRSRTNGEREVAAPGWQGYDVAKEPRSM